MVIRDDIIAAAQEAISQNLPDCTVEQAYYPALAAFNAIIDRLREPSEAMISGAKAQWHDDFLQDYQVKVLWKSMLSALSGE
jgi:hypothetical protein